MYIYFSIWHIFSCVGLFVCYPAFGERLNCTLGWLDWLDIWLEWRWLQKSRLFIHWKENRSENKYKLAGDSQCLRFYKFDLSYPPVRGQEVAKNQHQNISFDFKSMFVCVLLFANQLIISILISAINCIIQQPLSPPTELVITQQTTTIQQNILSLQQSSHTFLRHHIQGLSRLNYHVGIVLDTDQG